MNKDFSDLPFKQLLVPPHRMETNVSQEDIPIYAAINPIVPPFLPYRRISRFPASPSLQQQIHLLKTNKEK
ncbi:hypothetical protein ACN6MT_16215 [Neobacillus niacini]|uniref:hypothetical protein n=1 Tax=Neobacillus niacini TaxID=86668 RepID=UPI003B01FEE3